MKLKSLINGKLVDSTNQLIIKSPINNEEIGSVPALSKKQIDEAFKSARVAFNEWKLTDYKQRITFINQFKKCLIKNRKEIATTMSLEISKPIKACFAEFDRTIEYIDLTIDVYKKEFTKPFEIDEKAHGIKGKTGKFYYCPLGVVLAISPFNYPLNLSLAKIAPALLAGNTVVFKPATQGSLVGALIAKCFHEAKFPKGVINVVTGKGSEIGDHIIQNGNIDMVSFTGGPEIGKKIANCKPMVPIVLELGGKDVALVLKDADLKATAKEIVKGSLDYAGQRCTAIKIVYVHDSIADKLIKEVTELTKKIKVGHPFEDVDFSSMISESSVKWAKKLIDDALNKKAKLILGNKFDKNIIFPTIIDKVNNNMKIFYEEQFAPIIPFARYKDLDEAIKWFNESKYGLQGSIFSKDVQKAAKIAMLLDSGSININKSSARGPDIFPFSGIKDSGFGVQGVKWALLSMTRIKGIVFNK